MKIKAADYQLVLETPFAIARGTTSVHSICVAEIEHQGVRGLGEASPSAYYGDSMEQARQAIIGAASLLGDDPFALEAVAAALLERFASSPSGRVAVEAALYDIVGKLTGRPVYRLLGLGGLQPPPTSLTVGVTDVSHAERRIEYLRKFPILKVKLGFGEEYKLLSLLRRETDAVLRADANEGWSLEEAVRRINAYSGEFGVEFFEQPLPKEDLEGYRALREKTRTPVIIDEGVRCKEDVLRWSGLVDGINVKLMKCGGIRETVRTIDVARASGLKVMLGCMIESSLGISAAWHIAPLVDYCDLDGNLLITNDPFTGLKATAGRVSLTDLPGLGVIAALQ